MDCCKTVSIHSVSELIADCRLDIAFIRNPENRDLARRRLYLLIFHIDFGDLGFQGLYDLVGLSFGRDGPSVSFSGSLGLGADFALGVDSLRLCVEYCGDAVGCASATAEHFRLLRAPLERTC